MKYSLSSVTARITRLARPDTHEKADTKLSTFLMRESAGTFVLKVISTGLTFLISILLARLLGAKGYGIYAYALAWVGLLAVPATLGLDRLLVREVAVYQTQSAWGLMKGLLLRSNQAVAMVSFVLIFLAALGAWSFTDPSDLQMLTSFLVALIMVPLFTLTSLRQAALRGLGNIVAGQLPEMFFQPMIFISLIGTTYLLLGRSLSTPWAVGMNAMSAGIAFIVGARLLYKRLPQFVADASPDYKTRLWARSALPLLFIAAMQALNSRVDTIMLGAIKGAETVGIYAVANRGAGLITFILLAVNAALAPAIASLYAAKDMRQLQNVITRSARMILFISLPAGLGLILFGDWFLLLFGQKFTQGETALAILSTGQLVSAAMGSVGLLLIMTGHERDAVIGIGISTLLNVGLNAILIPLWALEGAAAAAATSLITWNILSAILVHRRLGIHSTALGKLSILKKSHEV